MQYATYEAAMVQWRDFHIDYDESDEDDDDGSDIDR